MECSSAPPGCEGVGGDLRKAEELLALDRTRVILERDSQTLQTHIFPI